MTAAEYDDRFFVGKHKNLSIFLEWWQTQRPCHLEEREFLNQLQQKTGLAP
ncbi:hypothetical protein ACFQY3_00900 [Paenibacillus farraposensis]|uniref:hypothetical protein n=1 Tax=Paenibacillus farraposensis TaxID=2807095 RepID=UPI00360D2484